MGISYNQFALQVTKNLLFNGELCSYAHLENVK